MKKVLQPLGQGSYCLLEKLPNTMQKTEKLTSVAEVQRMGQLNLYSRQCRRN